MQIACHLRVNLSQKRMADLRIKPVFNRLLVVDRDVVAEGCQNGLKLRVLYLSCRLIKLGLKPRLVKGCRRLRSLLRLFFEQKCFDVVIGPTADDRNVATSMHRGDGFKGELAVLLDIECLRMRRLQHFDARVAVMRHRVLVLWCGPGRHCPIHVSRINLHRVRVYDFTRLASTEQSRMPRQVKSKLALPNSCRSQNENDDLFASLLFIRLHHYLSKFITITLSQLL